MQEDPVPENNITEVKTDQQPAKGSTYMDVDEADKDDGEVRVKLHVSHTS